jgi:hypothetical protein
MVSRRVVRVWTGEPRCALYRPLRDPWAGGFHCIMQLMLLASRLVSAGDLLQLALAAQGGVERFQRAREITVDMHGSGAVVRGKRWGRIPGHIQVRCDTREQRSVISPFPSEGKRGVFTPSEVRIESVEDGSRLSSRADPRSKFPGGRRLLWWDDLDFLYFSGYAVWGYSCAPYTFLWDGVESREIEPWEQDGETWRRLEVTYPPGFHAHSRQQIYYFDSTGLLRRNDYTAEVFGGFAKSAHMSYEHKEFDGLLFPTRRRVYSRSRSNKPRPFPTLVSIDIARVEVR